MDYIFSSPIVATILKELVFSVIGVQGIKKF